MEQLHLAVSPPRIEGSGTDCIGPFVLDGVFTAGGGVSIQKTYVGQHGVTYDGHYDGEGRMWGMWKCGPDMGRWMIAMRHQQNAAEISEEVEEIRAGRKDGDTARLETRRHGGTFGKPNRLLPSPRLPHA
jgi:hypothetical protein